MEYKPSLFCRTEEFFLYRSERPWPTSRSNQIIYDTGKTETASIHRHIYIYTDMDMYVHTERT